MNADKALLPLCGRRLIERAIDILHSARLPVSISGSRADLGGLAPVLADMEPPQGPLTGICSALHALAEPWIVLLTVDMPLVPPSLVEYMLDIAIESDAAVVIPSCGGLLHPFPCVLQRDLVDGLASEHKAGRYGCMRAFSAAAARLGRPIKALRLESLAGRNILQSQPSPPVDAWLLNINCPLDLRRAEEWIAPKRDV